jgi:hypothetical protein
MKRIIFSGTLLIIFAACCVAHAGIDLGAYKGYSSGIIKIPGKNPRVSGSPDGLIGHYNMTVPEFIQIGIGPYFEYGPQTWERGNEKRDYTTTALGLDLCAKLRITEAEKQRVHPYGRVSVAIWDHSKFGNSKSTNYFKSYSYGGGIDFTIYPIGTLFDIRLFGEYLRTTSKRFGKDIAGYAVNLGVRLNI